MKLQKNTIVFPLLLARENENLVVTELKGGSHFTEKCINQGIVPGQEIMILNNTGRGPYIIAINNARVMISGNMLNRIYVAQK